MKSSCPALSWLVSLVVIQTAGAANWPQFRGPGGLAVADEPEPPTFFGPASNVLWQAELPAGHSSPIVWGDRIFLTGVEQQKLETLCLDRRDGRILWRQAAPPSKIEATHRLGSPAAPTPCTDGERAYAYFGSFGLIAYDFTGNEVWRKPLSAPVVEFGASASPILAGGLLIQVCDQDEGSFLLAVDRRTGETVWRRDRAEFRRSFSTPFAWRHDSAEELIVPGSIWLKSYDLKNGAERWTYSGTSRVANSTPSAGDGLLFYASWNIGGDEGARISMPSWGEFTLEHDGNHDGLLTREEIPDGPVKERFSQMDLNKDSRITEVEWSNMAAMFAKAGNAVLALKAGGSNDVTATHLAWKSARSLPYVSSPLYHRGRLFTVKSGGLASSYEAKTGRVLFQDERLGVDGDYYSSAVACGSKIFLGSQKGVLLVLTAGDRLEVLARNEFHEPLMATPAIADGRLYVRAATKLYAFASSTGILPVK